MKTFLTSPLRAAAFVAPWLLLPLLGSAKNFAATDRPNQLLSANGILPVKSAGPYVEVGTYQIQVTAKLGRPAERLANGTWLYQNYFAEDSVASGTLVIHFTADGRVRAMSLATPAVVAALHLSPKNDDRNMTARESRR